MIDHRLVEKYSKETCLTDEDLYRYISRQADAERISLAESHFAACSACRRNLANLIEILHPEGEQTAEIPEPSKAELDRTIEAIQDIARKEHFRKNQILRWIRWPMAAAAAITLVALSQLAIKQLQEKNRSEAFFLQARTMLEQNYTGTSPDNLRLSLPFSPKAANRGDSGSESLRSAENLFFQALAIREDMVEAHLGLGFIYLNESKFARARNEFQKVLDIRKSQSQALLGRGVVQYEEAIQGPDPLQRDVLLKSALNDFDAVLKMDPDLAEARYDKIWSLFESGQHKQALQEIELYFSHDSGSVWAEGLKALRTRIKATQSSAVEEEVNRAARARDRAALVELSRQIPYQIPPAIWSAMRRGLAGDNEPAKNGDPSSEDLHWAAETMEAAYSETTGDHSFRAFIDYYDGLSPPERELKKSLDRTFQNLVKLHQSGKFDPVLSGSKSLESQYEKIKDWWQLANLHHLRGNCLYLGKADFHGAEAEYRKMYQIADRLNMPDETALALEALAVIYSVQNKFDQSLASAEKVRNLAKKYKLDSWQISAGISLGKQYLNLGHFQQALNEYAAALNLAYRLLDGLKIIEALENSGIAMDRLGRAKEAGAFYRLASLQQDEFLKNLVLSPTPRLTSRRFNLLFKQGDLALRNGDLAVAKAFFQEVLKSAPPGMSELEARNRIGLSEVLLRTKRIREAEQILEPVMPLTGFSQYPEIGWKGNFLKGRLLEETGRSEEALQYYRQSISILQQMRQQIKPEDLKQSFLIDRYDPFKAAVELLFRSRGNEQELVKFVDEAKSTTLKEHLNPVNSTAPGKPQEQSFAIVEYFFTRDRLLILATNKGRTQTVARDISSNEIYRQVGKFLESVRKNDSSNFIRTAKLLYGELIEPIENSAINASSGTLVILPDGPLYLLPFAGLQDRAGRFLIEKTPIVFAPSRSVFYHCLNLHRGSASTRDDLLLVDGSAGLLNAQDEVAYISSLYKKNALIRSAKDVATFAREAEEANIFHFSGHAIIQRGQPALLLQRYPKEVYLDCQQIRTWRMPQSKLVNLAGCSTGIGPISDGEAPWGLIPAFLDAGSPAILASLMEVDDASTSRLSCRFYDQLRKGVGIAKALQTAQLALLDSVRTPSDTKPQSWTPYILVGNPQ
jgi:CHAT domain-containing protein/thioredoxin-like negative regulator of GroEL